MREIRTSGSMRGVGGNLHFYSTKSCLILFSQSSKVHKFMKCQNYSYISFSKNCKRSLIWGFLKGSY